VGIGLKRRKDLDMSNYIYLSNDSRYVAFSLNDANYDVLEVNGDYWPCPARRSKTKFPLVKCVGGFSCLTNKPFTFSLDLLICNGTKKVKAFMGNTIIEKKEVIFNKKVSYTKLPPWAKSFAELLKEIRGLKSHKS
jgi:hypothetical protein